MTEANETAGEMPEDAPSAPPKTVHGHVRSNLLPASLAALGIVFGDIGTSPLYTLKAVLALTGGKVDPAVILGILSLVIWTLVIITTLKYVVVAMSIDNDGEGGILALMSLVGQRSSVIAAAGLFGAALIYGDGAITPAISVLSALEGLNLAIPDFQRYVLQAAVTVLIVLFVAQPLGTERIGKIFGPIMTLWFFVLAVLGAVAVLHHPGVLAALNPLYGIRYLLAGGSTAFLILGAVFLCVTGAEALYADMGHFGPRPIRLTWLGLVFPSLLLNYAGQAAIVLDGGPTDGNIFYRLCPVSLLIPLVILATLATVIASQSIITGAYSMTRQAMRLGWLPRLAVKQTSDEGYGQIYVGSVNWILMLVTLALTLGFKKSDNLASAYGIAVSLTMLITTVLLFIAMREIWKWRLLPAAVLAAFLLLVDAAFFSANLIKVADGGYVPLALAAATFLVMWVWHRGSQAVTRQLEGSLIPIEEFVADLAKRKIPRVPGAAIFLTRTHRDVPPSLSWHITHNRALHAQVLVLTVSTASVPWTEPSKRIEMKEIAPGFWRAVAVYGYMEHPDIPVLLRALRQLGCGIDLDDVTYYVGRAAVVHRIDGSGMPRWQEMIYAALERNSSHVGDLLRLPPDNTVELGRQFGI